MPPLTLRHVFVTNSPVMSCCGQAREDCRCGDNPTFRCGEGGRLCDKCRARRRQLDVNTADAGLPIPELVFNNADDDPDDAYIVNEQGDGGLGLGIPTINWQAVQRAERRSRRQEPQELTANTTDTDDIDGLPIPTLIW